jgi:hypothetical protein
VAAALLRCSSAQLKTAEAKAFVLLEQSGLRPAVALDLHKSLRGRPCELEARKAHDVEPVLCPAYRRTPAGTATRSSTALQPASRLAHCRQAGRASIHAETGASKAGGSAQPHQYARLSRSGWQPSVPAPRDTGTVCLVSRGLPTPWPVRPTRLAWMRPSCWIPRSGPDQWRPVHATSDHYRALPIPSAAPVSQGHAAVSQG